MDRLAAMQSFVCTVERGSFAAAARVCTISPAMVGNHVRFLENRLGTTLLHRSTRRQSVTEAGHSYYERCRTILLDIEAADASASVTTAAPQGLLRVTAPLAIGATILPRIVGGFLKRHEAVRVDLVLSESRLDLLTDKVDVAIRIGTLADSGLIARSLPPLPLVLCASPAYLARRGVPRAPMDLVGHECIDFFTEGPHAWHFKGPQGSVAVPVAGRLRINSGQALRVAALEGVGIIMPPAPIVADDLQAGRLVRLLPDHQAPVLAVHALTLADANTVPKIRSFIDMLAGAMKRR